MKRYLINYKMRCLSTKLKVVKSLGKLEDRRSSIRLEDNCHSRYSFKKRFLEVLEEGEETEMVHRLTKLSSIQKNAENAKKANKKTIHEEDDWDKFKSRFFTSKKKDQAIIHNAQVEEPSKLITKSKGFKLTRKDSSSKFQRCKSPRKLKAWHGPARSLRGVTGRFAESFWPKKLTKHTFSSMYNKQVLKRSESLSKRLTLFRTIALKTRAKSTSPSKKSIYRDNKMKGETKNMTVTSIVNISNHQPIIR